LSVCLFVLTVKGKQLELSIPNLAHIYSVAVTRPSACIDPEVKGGQRSRSYLRENHHGHTVSSDHVPYSVKLYAAGLSAAIAGVGPFVDTTAYVF